MIYGNTAARMKEKAQQIEHVGHSLQHSMTVAQDPQMDRMREVDLSLSLLERLDAIVAVMREELEKTKYPHSRSWPADH